MKKYIFCSLLLVNYSLIFAQTAAELELVLGVQTVSAAQAARFVLGAADLLPTGLSGPQAQTAAYRMARERGWLGTEAAGAISLRDTAFLIMQAFGFKGGIMYSIFENPRYAYREMLHRRIIQGRADPAMTVSGQRLMQIIGSALSYSGENELMDARLSRSGGIM